MDPNEDIPYMLRIALHFAKHPVELTKWMRGSSLDAFGSLYSEYLRKQEFIVRRKNFLISLNPRDSVLSPIIWKFKSYEPVVTSEVIKTLKHGQTFVDVGANIGWYTLLGATLVGPSGRVLAIEPEPENFKLLSSSIDLNRFKSVTAVRECASRQSSMVTLYLRVPVGHTLLPEGGGETIQVASCTLDELATRCGIERIDLCKIDVEGAEPDVLEGATELLRGGRIDHIICEWNSKSWAEHSELLDSLFRTYYCVKLTGARIQLPVLRNKQPLSRSNLRGFNGNVEFIKRHSKLS